jgi:hypothetical protein
MLGHPAWRRRKTTERMAGSVLRTEPTEIGTMATLTMEAMNEDGWNAVALPIPADATAELLMEINSWARDRAQVYGDALKGEFYGFKEENDPPADQARKLRMAQMRIVQTEWRLNVLGLFQAWGGTGWAPPEGNEYVNFLIKRMAEPGNYEDPCWRPPQLGLTNG